MKKPSEILSSPKKWLKGTYRLPQEGPMCDAKQFCLMGAVIAAPTIRIPLHATYPTNTERDVQKHRSSFKIAKVILDTYTDAQLLEHLNTYEETNRNYPGYSQEDLNKTREVRVVLDRLQTKSQEEFDRGVNNWGDLGHGTRYVLMEKLITNWNDSSLVTYPMVMEVLKGADL